MEVLDLFSGIGGFSLGLERAGMTTVAFCEINPFCQRVLREHWPDVPIYNDIRELSSQHLAADGIVPDVLCGGFPCQDISSAGGKIGINGERSGLWSEFARLIGELRPRFAIVENVSDLLSRGLGDILGDLASLGYDAEWHCISAAHVGAPHIRDRVWIIAHAHCQSKHDVSIDAEVARISPGGSDADGSGLAQPVRTISPLFRRGKGQFAGLDGCDGHPWIIEPDVGRVADGISARVDRLRSLGNSLVPQIAEAIGCVIMRCANANAS